MNHPKFIERDKITACINLIQKLMNDFCKKLNNLQFVECSTTLKGDNLVADVVKNLKNENKEELDLFKNFLNMLEKIPEILQKYYNVDLDQVIDICTYMLKNESFTYEDNKIEKIIEKSNFF